MAEVSTYLGDSDRGMSDINVGGLALGLAVGMALGLVHVPTPGGGFTVGAAAGTLLVGLVFGRLGRVGPVITSMSHGAAQSLSALGMVTFLAYAGVRAGRWITNALASDSGWKVAVLGLVLTASAAVLLVLGMHVLRKLTWLEPRGPWPVHRPSRPSWPTSTTRPATTPGSGSRTPSSLPVAIVSKIIVAQVLAGLG